MHLRRRTAAGKNETRSVPVMLWNNIESEKKNRHSSEIKRFMLDEIVYRMLQHLPYFWNKKTQNSFFFRFSFLATLDL